MIVILGGGESGVGAALLAKKLGKEVMLSDSGTLKDEYRKQLAAADIRFEEGGHSEDIILNAEEVIKSPGIPEKAPLVKKLREKGVSIISEIEYGGRYTKARKVCITGANGKTTSTLLTHHLLTNAGIKASLAGNVGFSLARQVAEGNEPDWYVIELSSFQLDGMYDFRADIGILTNITPDHLDRYEYKFENYIYSKFRILQNMGAGQLFIANADDPVTTEYLPKVMEQGKLNCPMLKASWSMLNNETITLTVDGKTVSFKLSDMTIEGKHNIYNTMQSVMAAMRVGLSQEQIIAGLRTFKNAEHRLEPVGEINGALYINDSKATNVDSAWYALDAQKRPVVWIAGGTDKGNDYSTLMDLVDQKVHTLVCLGVDNQKLIASYTGHVENLVEARSIGECIEKCMQYARPGDVVLLSPCCASFDLFKSYVDRGNQFRAEVKKYATK